MLKRSILLSTVCAISLSGCIINVSKANMAPLEHKHQSLQLDATELEGLIATTGAGALNIQGVAGLNHVKLEADIYTRDGISPNLSLKRQGNQAIVVADFNDQSYSGRSPYIDVTLRVPARFNMEIEDGSGSIDIDGVNANIAISDGSGSLSVTNGNNLTINDGSGSIAVRDIQGEVSVDDGSGSMELVNIGGDVMINDGSGDLSVRDVAGKVTIDDGSGDIDINNAQALNIIDAGSGDVTVDNVERSMAM
ncbi:DUF4097 family beta strand repeat-containing protein [Shewanella waksmanii]|uniref:DUF4097 family beta strand repeat-containing protein n=1 Tax=Shewanella waksmanii TaxID=213783 RepID=UPI0004B63B25|nr:DUF4097 family beta strand repeat-containing protein [Shewanella waksmanii]